LRRVAGWGYGKALQSGGRAWKAPSQFEPVDAGYLHVLTELR
jgi:hypothetical protein